jgi:hypothetical protein
MREGRIAAAALQAHDLRPAGFWRADPGRIVDENRQADVDLRRGP